MYLPGEADRLAAEVEDSPSSSMDPISSLGRFRCALGPKVFEKGSVSTI
jgi:hypothetical protein